MKNNAPQRKAEEEFLATVCAKDGCKIIKFSIGKTGQYCRKADGVPTEIFGDFWRPPELKISLRTASAPFNLCSCLFVTTSSSSFFDDSVSKFCQKHICWPFDADAMAAVVFIARHARSEEHTSELQSAMYLV